MPPLVQSTLELIGAVVVAGGGLSLIVYAAFKRLAEKWLDSKFEQRLQELKHKHESELEHLRFRINALLDRTTKLNEREFEVLPQAWSKLHDAFWQSQTLVSALQSYPDLERMTQGQLRDFLEACKLESWQKQELTSSTNKNDYYQEQIYWYRLARTLDVIRDTNVYLAQVGIFMLPDIRRRFTDLAALAFAAVGQDRFNHEHKPRPLMRDKIELFVAEGETRLNELERVVHSRLWPAERSAA